MKKAAPCAFCDAPSTHLCDFEHGWSHWEDDVDSKGKTRRVMSMQGSVMTCDAPICEACRTQVGILFGKGFVETKDHCPVHRERERVRFIDAGEKSAGEVEAIRLRDWKFRYLQRQAPVPTPQLSLGL